MRPFILTAALTLAISPAAQADPYLYETQALTDHAWMIYRPDPQREPVEGNVLVVEQAEGLVVVDAGGSPLAGRRIIAQIRALSDKPVSHVVVTHWHGDHHLGLPAFREAWPDLDVIAQTRTSAYMSGPQMDYLETMTPDVFETAAAQAAAYAETEAFAALPEASQLFVMRMVEDFPVAAEAAAGFEPTRADRGVPDRLVLDDAVAPVEIIHPGTGNTDGDLIVWLPEQGVLATGDLVVAPTPFGFGSAPRAWADTLERVGAYEFAHLVPGHGPAMSDRAYLDQLIALFDWVADAAEAAPADETPEAFAERLDWSEWDAVFVAGDPLRNRSFRDYFKTPIAGHALQEARGEAIEQGGE